MNHILEFRAAIQAAGLTAPEEIIDDGKRHRFASNGNPRDKSGWYQLWGDERPAGVFGCWKHQIKQTWKSSDRRVFTEEERAAWRQRMEQIRAARAEAERQQHERAAEIAADMWARAGAADGHPYLARKLVGAYGVRELDGELLMPLRSGPGAYVGLERIMPQKDGGKFLLKGTPAAGAYHVIGKPARDGLVVIVEGYATGASVHEALGCCAVVARNAGNLLAVAQKIRTAMPLADIVIGGDDDAWTVYPENHPKTGQPWNPGVEAARAAAVAINGRAVFPRWAGHRAVKKTDFNDLHADEGLDAVAACFETLPRGSGLDDAESVQAARAENNPASTEAGAAPSPVDSAVDVPEPMQSAAPTAGAPVSDASDIFALRPVDVFKPIIQGEEPEIFATSPRDTAHKFYAHLRDDGRVWYWRGDFYMWNGHRYEMVEQTYVHKMLYDFMEMCVTQKTVRNEPQVVAFTPTKKNVEDVMHALRASCFVNLPEPPSWIDRRADDPDPSDIMAFRNGFLHIPTRTLMPATSRLFITNSMEFDYDPAAPAPIEWLKFLSDIWPNEPDSIEAVGDMFGYMLTGDTSQQKMFMLIGPPRSGKGTILRVLEAVVGEHNRASPSLASLGTNFGLQPLVGKRLAMISDARLSGKADQAPIAENLLRISGEDSITLDRKNQTAWSGKLSTRFVMAANGIPAFTDHSGALPNRFIMLKMHHSNLGKEDPGLSARLLRELPGIVLWALDGLDRLRQRGYLLQSKSGSILSEDMRKRASYVTLFAEETCVIGAGNIAERNTLYLEWVEWCKAIGLDHSGNALAFCGKLTEAFPGVQEVGAALHGIRLRHSHEPV